MIATNADAFADVAGGTDDVQQRWMVTRELSRVIDLWNRIDAPPSSYSESSTDSRNDLPDSLF